jgi:hypothetical protein
VGEWVKKGAISSWPLRGPRGDFCDFGVLSGFLTLEKSSSKAARV